MKIVVSNTIAEAARQFDRLPKQIAFGTALGLTRTAQQARDDVYAAMRAVFDRPVPFTLRGLRVERATPARLSAVVAVKGYEDFKSPLTVPPDHYLAAQIDGGTRRTKALEEALQAIGAMPKGWVAVPGKAARLDAFGNMSRGQVIQILSQLRVQLTGGFDRAIAVGQDKASQGKRRRAFGRAGGQFVAYPERRGKLLPGVYLVEARDFGAKLGLGKTGRISPVLIFVRRAQYRARLNFFGLVQRRVQASLAVNIDDGIAHAIATAKSS